MWFESVVKAISGLKKYQVYLGRVPHFVSGPALIIFPLRRNVLACGLAGIISIKRAAPGIARVPQLVIDGQLPMVGFGDGQEIGWLRNGSLNRQRGVGRRRHQPQVAQALARGYAAQ